MFLKYPKIHRLGSEENDGVLIGTCYVQEKIDGANTSIWIEEDGVAGAKKIFTPQSRSQNSVLNTVG